MLDDEELLKLNPSGFDVGVTNSTATTPSLLSASPSNAPPIRLTAGPSSTDDLLASLSASPAPLSASPAMTGSSTTPQPMPQAQNVPRGTSQDLSSNAPAPTLADILAGAQKSGQSMYGNYTPENRQELLKYMLQKQNSLASGIGQGLAGLGDAIARGPGHSDTHFLENSIKEGKDTTNAALGNFDEMAKSKSQTIQAGMSLQQMDPTSPASKSMQTAARPMLRAAGLSDKQIASLPANAIDQALKSATSFADAKAKLAQVAAMKEYNQGFKHDSQQNQIENQAIQRVSSVRGDQSLKDAEAKRDAAITVYNTIENLKKEGRMPSKLEYYDLLGQMWKARTGASPTDQAIKDLDSQTFKGDLNRAATYFSGKPGGATTGGVLQNIQDFAKESGNQADQFHESYMKPHLIKPSGLDDDRWQPILSSGRGRSFADATKAAAQAPAADHQAALAWAQKNPTDPRSQIIMQRATMALGGANGIQP